MAIDTGSGEPVAGMIVLPPLAALHRPQRKSRLFSILAALCAAAVHIAEVIQTTVTQATLGSETNSKLSGYPIR